MAAIRLLNVYRLEFREFDLTDAPLYVIASHTWARGSEVTYEELRQGRGRDKAGYQKVVGFANYMKEHVPNVEWLWIDTCCINKADSQEVSRSINSMFRWYLHAAVCLAYLPDVHACEDGRRFTESEWFKRGWTLQELLASRAVVFLTQDWQVIGHKADGMFRSDGSLLDIGVLLNDTVATVTGVPKVVLGNFYLSGFLSVEERLRWIEKRKTTKPEDMSYSLIGIFDVKMPTEYDIGKDEARRRLLAQIKQNKSTLDRLPATSGAAFDSRENEVVVQCLPDTRVNLLQEIDEWASSKDGAVSAQLARRLPNVSAGVISALEMNPDIMRKSLKEQFQELILQPLQRFASPPVYGPAWVMCIDALDECDNETDINAVLSLLARLQRLKSANFRFFLTSRPDLPLRLGFGRISKDSHVDVRLEDIPEQVIAHDIAVYFEHRLSEIRSDHASLNGLNTLRRDWPGEHDMQALIQMAQPLFIFAATVCRLLGELDEDPNESLRNVLQHGLESSQLDRTYQPVLDRLLTNKIGKQRDRIIDEFQQVVGSIVNLAEPLTIVALSRVLEVPKAKVTARLQRLHSVLDVPSAEDGFAPVRPLHLSFRDYLTDPETRKKTPFWVDEVQQHRNLTSQCLRLLSQPGTLHEDLCRVGKPGTQKADIHRQQIQESIASDVAYACRYWVHHLCKSKEQPRDDGQVH